MALLPAAQGLTSIGLFSISAQLSHSEPPARFENRHRHAARTWFPARVLLKQSLPWPIIEIRCGLLAYNLIRQAIAEVAIKAGLMPRTLSFATAMQAIAASLGILSTATEEVAARLIAAQLASLSQQTVGNRPNRIEPRAVKRSPQPIALLTKPRNEAHAELLQGAAA